MYIKRLIINDFRNMEYVELEPCQGFNFLCGANGSGKTSVIEAIHYLSLARSFRTSSYQYLIKQGKPKFNIFALVQEDNGGPDTSIGMSRARGESPIIKINSDHVSRMIDLIDLICVQIIHPQGVELITKEAEGRRSFIDWGVYYSDPEFKHLWLQYRKILKQRNTLLRREMLKRKGANRAMAEAYANESMNYGHYSNFGVASQVSDNCVDLTAQYHEPSEPSDECDEACIDVASESLSSSTAIGSSDRAAASESLSSSAVLGSSDRASASESLSSSMAASAASFYAQSTGSSMAASAASSFAQTTGSSSDAAHAANIATRKASAGGFSEAWDLGDRSFFASGAGGLDEVTIWDEQLALLSEQITEKRLQYLSRLQVILQEITGRFLPDFKIKFELNPGWEKGLNLRSVLAQNLEKDKGLGYTFYGCHRADLKIKNNTVSAGATLSRGQLKMLVYALRLAQGMLLKEHSNRACIYLIDDLNSELDDNSQRELLNTLVQCQHQVFISNIRQELLIPKDRSDYKVFALDKGMVSVAAS